MLKALIFAADAVSPDYILDKRELFPNLSRMIEEGASARYSTYVQKGYEGSYSSEQNWASIYTGLTPREHGITTCNIRGEMRRPEMRDFDNLQPFWKVLNDNGLSVGLWAADNCVAPRPINGYAVSCKYDMIDTPIQNREAPRTIQLCEKDQYLAAYLGSGPPPRRYPKTLLQQGYTFEQLKRDADLAEEAIAKYHFQDSLENLEAELNYFINAMIRVQREHPVDALFFYTVTTDLIAHCCLYCEDNDVLIAAYKLMDKYLGKLIEEVNPEIIVFLSDHGQQNFKDLINCSNIDVQREAFAARDEVLWLKDGYIAFEAHNGALLFTAHALKGTFIASGKGIKHISVNEMRSLDIYPTLLEMLNIKIPENRYGYVVDIFNKPVANSNKLLNPDTITHKSIALLQCHAVNLMDIFINELYIENRFADITVVGELKYAEIFLNNPRVTGFIAFDRFDAASFDEVYCGVYNENSKVMRHIRICGGQR